MPELVAQRFAPLGCGSLAIPLQCASQVPQMFGGMKEVEHFNGSRPAILCYLPNPRCAITHHQFVLSSAQAMEPAAKLYRIALRQPTTILSTMLLRPTPCGQPSPADNTRPPSICAIPHGFLPAPAWAALAHLPAIKHQHPSFCRRRWEISSWGGFLVELAAVLRHGFQVIRSRNGAPNC
jgi:hypothetical protein